MTNKALGIIETKGLICAIAAADQMVKSANVSIINKKTIGKGFVSILISGDVESVKHAIEIGSITVKKLGILKGIHVIPRPSKELDDIIF